MVAELNCLKCGRKAFIFHHLQLKPVFLDVYGHYENYFSVIIIKKHWKEITICKRKQFFGHLSVATKCTGKMQLENSNLKGKWIRLEILLWKSLSYSL